MRKLILGIGIPGSGKTTVLKAFAEEYNYEYISADEIRSDLNISIKNPLITSDNPLTISMWNEIRNRTREALSKGKTVVLDATFTKLELRQEFIKLARENGAEKIQGVFLDTPSEIAWERSEKRERRVPENLFKERVESIKKNPPMVEDGFDAVFTINEYENLFKIENKDREKNLPYKKAIRVS